VHDADEILQVVQQDGVDALTRGRRRHDSLYSRISFELRAIFQRAGARRRI
jgi:hypothetical protein